MKSGYYLVRDKNVKVEVGLVIASVQTGRPEVEGTYDIASYDEETNALAFTGDSPPYEFDPDRWDIIKYICDPQCRELRT